MIRLNSSHVQKALSCSGILIPDLINEGVQWQNDKDVHFLLNSKIYAASLVLDQGDSIPEAASSMEYVKQLYDTGSNNSKLSKVGLLQRPKPSRLSKRKSKS